MTIPLALRDTLAIPFGFVMALLYSYTGNYLLSLTILTIVVKAILFPTAIKQQKGTAKQARLQPRVKKIQTLYAGNQQKIQEETQALYQKEGYNQMSSGCLPLLIQLPIMMGLWNVMYTPLTNVLRVPASVITNLTNALTKLDPALQSGKNTQQIEIKILERITDLEGTKGLTPDILADIKKFMSGFKFLGINLWETPSVKGGINKLWLIPVLAFVTALASSIYLYYKQKQTNPAAAGGPTAGCMALMSPLMSLFFTFMFPAGVGFYWIMSNVFSFLQSLLMYGLYDPKKVIAKTMVEETIIRRSYENNVRLVIKNKSER